MTSAFFVSMARLIAFRPRVTTRDTTPRMSTVLVRTPVVCVGACVRGGVRPPRCVPCETRVLVGADVAVAFE